MSRYHGVVLAFCGSLFAFESLGADEPCPAGEWAGDLFQFPGTSGGVRALAVFDDGSGPALYVAGEFDTVGDAVARNIARWDGENWSEVGGGTNARINTLAVFDDGSGPALFAAGILVEAGGVATLNIARWDGSAWSPVGNGPTHEILALSVLDDGSGPALFAGGRFQNVGGVPARHVARWNGVEWSPVGTGLDGGVNRYVSALAVFDDGTAGTMIYAGGSFISASGAPVNNIARFDGTSWSAVGPGFDGEVSALAVHGSGAAARLIAGGRFTNAGATSARRIAEWYGANWGPLGTGFHDSGCNASIITAVSALVVHDDGTGPMLFAGGRFCEAGATSASSMARWDGTSWSALGAGVNSGFFYAGSVFALASFDDDGGPALFAGGAFSTAGATSATGIARWDGSWSSLATGFPHPFRGADVIASFDGGSGPRLHAGGFGQGNTYRFEADGWEPLGAGLYGTNLGDDVTRVDSFRVFDDGTGSALYAGGLWVLAGGSRRPMLARWDGTDWSKVGTRSEGGANGEVFALDVFDDGRGPALYAGGQFTGVDVPNSLPAMRIARWDGVSFEALGSGIDDRVFALAGFDDGSGPALYAGGEFSSAGGVPTSRVARWDGVSWSALGSGIDGSVFALTAFDDGTGTALYAGGLFTSAGGVPARNVAKWDGANWSALGGGLFRSDGFTVFVADLHVFDDGQGPALYACGSFTTDGASALASIARWSGGSWSPLGDGLNARAASMTSLDEPGTGPSLYVCGVFSAAGDVPSQGVAKWSMPECVRARWGNVNAAAGPLANVLFVNGRKGSGPARRLVVGRNELFQIRMKAPPALGAGPAPFALYAKKGSPGPLDLTPAPSGIGTMCFDLTRAHKTWNNTGDTVRFGEPDLPSSPATSTVFRRENGLGRRITFFIQGIIADPASPSGEYAVTNGIEVTVE